MLVFQLRNVYSSCFSYQLEWKKKQTKNNNHNLQSVSCEFYEI